MGKILDINIKTNTFVTCILLPETKYEVEVSFDDGTTESFATMFFEGQAVTRTEDAVTFLKSWLKTDRTSYRHEGINLVLQDPKNSNSRLSFC
ncbi:MAG: hypothetical protein LBO81_05690 [Clostridiales Family XIII bacterium]|jgi:hypothetical protein|nr:hypothetical protein [Clostridiales Family XIII bacterium]